MFKFEKKIRASNGVSVHTIKFDSLSGFTCTCQSFRIHKQECKHVKEAKIDWFKNNPNVIR